MANVYIQWKGTDACLDFYCDCDPSEPAHLHGDFVYSVKCPQCGKIYTLPDMLTLTDVQAVPVKDRHWSANDKDAKVPENPHGRE